MPIIWGSNKWQIVTAIALVLIFGYGTYAVLMDIFTGHPIWWYNASFILFALALLGGLLMVRQGRAALGNIVAHGFNPSSKESQLEEEPERPDTVATDFEKYDNYFEDDQE